MLWLNVTQRTREIGLRRAKGATILNVQQQLVGEVAVLTTLAVLVGVVLVVQFPLLDLYGDIPAPVYLAGLAIALVGIYGSDPRLRVRAEPAGGRVQPAEALGGTSRAAPVGTSVMILIADDAPAAAAGDAGSRVRTRGRSLEEATIVPEPAEERACPLDSGRP